MFPLVSFIDLTLGSFHKITFPILRIQKGVYSKFSIFPMGGVSLFGSTLLFFFPELNSTGYASSSLSGQRLTISYITNQTEIESTQHLESSSTGFDGRCWGLLVHCHCGIVKLLALPLD